MGKKVGFLNFWVCWFLQFLGLGITVCFGSKKKKKNHSWGGFVNEGEEKEME